MLVCKLPKPFYCSYKFCAGEHDANPDFTYEADFIIAHPRLGYLVVEVKEGQYQYFNKCWQKQLGKNYVNIDTDPIKQAERAMYNILHEYQKLTGKSYSPLKFKYVFCFPYCRHLAGSTPDNLKPESIF